MKLLYSALVLATLNQCRFTATVLFRFTVIAMRLIQSCQALNLSSSVMASFQIPQQP